MNGLAFVTSKQTTITRVPKNSTIYCFIVLIQESTSTTVAPSKSIQTPFVELYAWLQVLEITILQHTE